MVDSMVQQLLISLRHERAIYLYSNELETN